MTNTEFTLRLLAALMAGLCIGFERQWHHKSAGLQTNMPVAKGAAIFLLIAVMVSVNGNVTRIILKRNRWNLATH
jgi:putative Mg2+ transporter-C (MgtC) family protein